MSLSNALSLRRLVALRASPSTPRIFLEARSHHRPAAAASIRGNIVRRGFVAGLAAGPASQARYFSLSSASAPAAATAATAASKPGSNTGNFFLDYAGSIFLGGIGMIIAWLMRSYQNTQRRNQFRDAIEEASHLDPLELDDLRVTNSETVTVEQFKRVMNELIQLQNRDDMTYQDFVQRTRSILMKTNDNNPAFTVQLGHLLDRVALSALKRHDKTLKDSMPLSFWLTLFSLSLSADCTATDRIQLLYQMMQAQADNASDGFLGTGTSEANDDDCESKVAIDQVVELVGYLQDTCQLVPDAQVVATARKYPLQEYAVGTPEQLVDRHRWVHKEALTGEVDCEAVSAILRSKSVCAWGECYHRRKFNA